jgi:hypothetical protein
MNSQQADLLRQAWLQGVRQIKGSSMDYEGGYCAFGILWNLNNYLTTYTDNPNFHKQQIHPQPQQIHGVLPRVQR